MCGRQPNFFASESFESDHLANRMHMAMRAPVTSAFDCMNQPPTLACWTAVGGHPQCH